MGSYYYDDYIQAMGTILNRSNISKPTKIKDLLMI